MSILQLIQEELNAPKNQKNNFGGYNFRSCEDILEALKPLLAKHKATIVISDEIVCVGGDCGIVYTDGVDGKGEPTRVVAESTGRMYVKSTAVFKCGEEREEASAFAREDDNKKGMDAAQLTGATSSYARKYALNGLLLIDDEKDSDATNEHVKIKGKPNNNQADDKPWYNTLNVDKPTMLAKLDSGEHKNTQEIVDQISAEFKMSFKDKAAILALTP